jgi:hypothetical protein
MTLFSANSFSIAKSLVDVAVMVVEFLRSNRGHADKD